MMNLTRLVLSASLSLLVVGRLSASETSSQEVGRIEAAPGPESVSIWESALQADPNNLDLRIKLLAYYSVHGPLEKYFPQALWIVQHHPESEAAGMRTTAGLVSGSGNLGEADRALLKAAWEQAIVDQADSGKVLYNAGSFFSIREPVKAVHMIEQARQLEPENDEILAAEANLYVHAFNTGSVRPGNPLDAWKSDDEQTLRSEIATASEPALLTGVGTRLIWMGQSNSNLKAKGTELINRAISLDPTNEKWKNALRSASMLPSPPSPLPPPGAAPSGAVRIGDKVAEANLIRKVDPVYPPLALQARISGSVNFLATISEDGHIQNLQLVRGHPLLVNAAKDAVLQYVYRPTMLNGNPVPVLTSVIVPFELPPPQ